MANVLKKEKQILCLKMLCEGSSIRSVERTTDVHRDTVMRLMVRFGDACGEFLDRELMDIETDHVELDEQWSWVFKKQGKLSAIEKNNPFLATGTSRSPGWAPPWDATSRRGG